MQTGISSTPLTPSFFSFEELNHCARECEHRAIEQAVYLGLSNLLDVGLSRWPNTLTDAIVRLSHDHDNPAVFLAELVSTLAAASAERKTQTRHA